MRAIRFCQTKSQTFIGLLIFIVCVWVYLANNVTLSTEDTFPNSLLALNWLENHTLHFNAFQEIFTGKTHFFTESPAGHLTSTYPIGTAIVTFPLYGLFFIYLKLAAWMQAGSPDPFSHSIDIVAASFRDERAFFEKLAATITTAFSVVLFYYATRLKFHQAAALLTTFIFAFATSTWSICAQGLWQHTAGNLLLVSIIFCLLKVNRIETGKKALLLQAGFFCGLLPGTRTPSLLFSVAIVLYVLLTYRREAVYFLIGLASLLLNATWNIYYFGFSFRNLIVGGYSRFSETSFVESHYRFTFSQFIEGCLGLLINPNVGFLVFSPIALFAVPGIRQLLRLRVNRDEQLLGCLLLASSGIFLQYCFFVIWSGGGSYGSRYLTDILPVVGFLIGYFLHAHFGAIAQRKIKFHNPIFCLFCIFLIYSTHTQIIGVFARTPWHRLPVRIPFSTIEPTVTEGRLWQLRDGAIERHTRKLFYRITKPIPYPKHYLKSLRGKIEAIKSVKTDQPLASPIVVHQNQKMVLQAKLSNTGEVPWFGYETGMVWGTVQVRGQFFDQTNTLVASARNALFASGTPEPGETTAAIGRVSFPMEPGRYQLSFSLIVDGIGEFPDSAGETKTWDVLVQPWNP